MMKKICLGLLGLLSPLAASATVCDAYPNLCRGTTTYLCQGPRVSGSVQITVLGLAGDAVRYRSVAKLQIDGGPVRTLEQKSTYVEYGQTIVDQYGSWVPDKTRWIYRLGGADLGLDPLKRGFHVEVKNGNRSAVVGYMGHLDDSFPADSTLSFRCR